MAKGAILTTTSIASLCLFLLGACSTAEEVPVETAAVPVEDPRPLPPPGDAPRSRLLIASTDTPGAAAPSPVEAQEASGPGDAPAGQPEESSGEPAPPVPSPRPAAAEQPLDDAQAPSAPPPKPQQAAEGISLEEPVEDAPELGPEELTPEIAGDAEEEEPQAAAEKDAAVPEEEATTAPDASESTEQAIELEEVEPEVQQAALPQAAPPERLRLQFDTGEVELTEPMQNQLMEIAQQLREHEEERVQLLAYASGHEEDISRARRLSLARALAVRAFLLDQGVRSTRMDVRALAQSEGGAPPDRVDVVPQGE